MNISGIEAFLAIVETGNISNASEKLFLSQSTVSHRLKLLEDELDIQLLIRNKGHRTIELTPYGKEFITIAERWISLWKSTQSLKSSQTYHNIIIGSVDSLNNHTLLENFDIDIGFVFSQVNYKNIITKPIYHEKMYLLCHKNRSYYNNIEPKMLSTKNEVYLKWGPEYQHWHDRHWSPDEKAYITVNTGLMLINYLKKKDNWSVAPLSIIKSFQHFSEIVYYSLNDPPPDHICYQLIHRYPKESHIRGINLFLRYLEAYINNCDWMNKY